MALRLAPFLRILLFWFRDCCEGKSEIGLLSVWSRDSLDTNVATISVVLGGSGIGKCGRDCFLRAEKEALALVYSVNASAPLDVALIRADLQAAVTAYLPAQCAHVEPTAYSVLLRSCSGEQLSSMSVQCPQPDRPTSEALQQPPAYQPERTGGAAVLRALAGSAPDRGGSNAAGPEPSWLDRAVAVPGVLLVSLLALAGVVAGLMIAPAKSRRSVGSQQGAMHAAGGAGGPGGAPGAGVGGRLSPVEGVRRRLSSGNVAIGGAPEAAQQAPTPLFVPLPASMEPPSPRPGCCSFLCPSRKRSVLAGNSAADGGLSARKPARSGVSSAPSSPAPAPLPVSIHTQTAPPAVPLADAYGLDPSIVFELEGGGAGASPQLPEGAVSASEWMQQRRARSAAALRSAHDAALARMQTAGTLAGRASPPSPDHSRGRDTGGGALPLHPAASPGDSAMAMLAVPGRQRLTTARTFVLADGRIVKRIGRDSDVDVPGGGGGAIPASMMSPGGGNPMGLTPRSGSFLVPSGGGHTSARPHVMQRDDDWDTLARVAGAEGSAAAGAAGEGVSRESFRRAQPPLHSPHGVPGHSHGGGGGGGFGAGVGAPNPALPPPPHGASSSGGTATPPRMIPPPPPLPPGGLAGLDVLGRLPGGVGPSTPRSSSQLPPPPAFQAEQLKFEVVTPTGSLTVGNPLHVVLSSSGAAPPV